MDKGYFNFLPIEIMNLFTLSATILGINLACTPLKNYRLFNICLIKIRKRGIVFFVIHSSLFK